MPRRRSQGRGRYYSSDEKDLVRKRYDLPLIQAVARRKSNGIRYFGLPGEEALDLICWGHLCEYIAAVEVFPDKFQTVKHVLQTQFGRIKHRAHLGDVDEVILSNGSKNPPYTFVSTTHLPDIGYIWDFDVIYLDYFGKFLPYGRGSSVVQKRANALRHLFASDRQDAREPWLLILTVESNLFDSRDRSQILEFLSASKEGVDEQTRNATDFLVEGSKDRVEQAARLIHGTLSHIFAAAASNSDVLVSPKPTLLYEGSNNTPMIHFAYEITPTKLLSGFQSALPLLRSPLLRVRDDYAEPWFELLPSQPPGQTDASLRASLNFLDDKLINQIL